MKKIITIILLIILFPYLAGCYSLKEITTEEIEDGHKGKLIILANDLVKYEFEKNMYSVTADSLYGYGTRVNAEEEELPFKGTIAFNDIRSVQLEQINLAATGCMGLGILTIVIILVFAIASPEISPVSIGHL